MRFLLISAFMFASAANAASMHIIYVCGEPAIIHGISDEGYHIIGSYRSLRTDSKIARIASRIISQLDKDEAGKPIITEIQADQLAGVECPISI